MKLFDANELLDKVKTKNMLLEKVKNLELKLSVAREQTNRTASSKLEHMLSIQKSPLDKTGLGFEDSIAVSKTHSTNFVSSSEPSMSEIVKPADVTPPRKIRVNLKESKPKTPNPPKDKVHDKPEWVCHFCRKFGHIHPNCCKLQTAKRANKPKVPVLQAQDPMVLIGELVKALNLYSYPGVAQYSNMNNNSNARVASKKFWMQKTRSNCVFLTWSLCFIILFFVTIPLCCFCFLCFFFLLGFALHSIYASHTRLFLLFFSKIKNKKLWKREEKCVLRYFS